MKLAPKDISGYIWAGVGGGALVLVIAVFCCIFRSVKQAVRNGVWNRESNHGMEEAEAYRKVVVGPDEPRRSSVDTRDRGWLRLGMNLKKATVVPLGLRGRGVSVPGEELRKHMRQEQMVFADAPVPGLLGQ